ncbi:MAG: hypothetical protein JRG67_02020 [Deltaproteobacteria bacterium]|nr:hypothetical protein [Deltaproteobacteria bacterium]MBW2209810.1 hypothetical protein [Deltaproteobacteria bacterium]
MSLIKQRFASCLLCLLAACSGSGVPMAPQRSPHFDAVSKEIQLGGTVYAYADIEGDAERAADFLLNLLRDLPGLVPQEGAHRLNPTTLVRILGLHNVRAIGLSSYETGSLYHNRSFIHHDGSREGLLKLFGAEPAAFDLLTIAPQDADLVWEQQLDVRALVNIVRSLGELGVGVTPQDLDKALGEPVLGLDMTLGAILERLNTTAGLILAVDESRPLRIPGESFWFPYTDFLFRIDGLGELADAIADKADFDPFIESERTEQWLTIRPAIRLPPPWNAYEPSVLKEIATGRMYIVSSPAFLKGCLSTTGGVTQSADFIRAFEQLPMTGNGLMYFSPRMTRQMHAVLDRVIEMKGSSVATSIARFFLPDVGYPMGWVARNVVDGLLITSNSPSSHKSTLLTLGYAALLPAAVVVGASFLEHFEVRKPPAM